ncbi:hypothetical protein EJ08DRAFT_728742 [Tothia fuscella]|uniref:Uncharacterized protein n=1 Tax=Tothia fuscella TaxID=1048955 RepID=A0A9P4U4V5_9PEZI|nr:hypothetical protein EJ08DRAFT_728742 [Tothia fuscella]
MELHSSNRTKAHDELETTILEASLHGMPVETIEQISAALLEPTPDDIVARERLLRCSRRVLPYQDLINLDGLSGLMALRLTCRVLEIKTLHWFATRLFSDIQIMLEPTSLGMLHEIAQNDFFRRHITSLTLHGWLLDDGVRKDQELEEGADTWEDEEPEEDALSMKSFEEIVDNALESSTYTLLVRAQKLFRHGGAQKLLEDILKLLPGLITFKFNDVLQKQKPGFSGWADCQRGHAFKVGRGCLGVHRMEQLTSIRPAIVQNDEFLCSVLSSGILAIMTCQPALETVFFTMNHSNIGPDQSMPLLSRVFKVIPQGSQFRSLTTFAADFGRMELKWLATRVRLFELMPGLRDLTFRLDGLLNSAFSPSLALQHQLPWAQLCLKKLRLDLNSGADKHQLVDCLLTQRHTVTHLSLKNVGFKDEEEYKGLMRFVSAGLTLDFLEFQGLSWLKSWNKLHICLSAVSEYCIEMKCDPGKVVFQTSLVAKMLPIWIENLHSHIHNYSLWPCDSGDGDEGDSVSPSDSDGEEISTAAGSDEVSQ